MNPTNPDENNVRIPSIHVVYTTILATGNSVRNTIRFIPKHVWGDILLHAYARLMLNMCVQSHAFVSSIKSSQKIRDSLLKDEKLKSVFPFNKDE